MGNSDFTSVFNTNETPQSQPVPGRSDQVKNNAGGYTFSVTPWKHLERFLILGTEGGTYYVNQKDLTYQNAYNVLKLIAEDGKRVVDLVVDISDKGRAAKNDAALFVLALAIKKGDVETRRYAAEKLSSVARIGTHLFTFLHYSQAFGGYGRVINNAVSKWYLDKSIKNAALQIVKYQSRTVIEGKANTAWSHADAIRQSHIKPPTEAWNQLFRFAGAPYKPVDVNVNLEGLELLQGVVAARNATTAKEIVKLIQDYNLPREVIPTQFLNEVSVWDALLEKMPVMAMIRNLNKMTAVGLLKPLSNAADKVVSVLQNENALRKARIHPVLVLNALFAFRETSGRSDQIVDALEDAFYKSFQNVEPTGKRFFLALDISGSMSWRSCSGAKLTPCEASTAMAMVTARSEQRYAIMGFSDTLRQLNITAKTDLKAALKITSNVNFGGTDCSLPMIFAQKAKLPVDIFVVYTDNETWAGKVHPFQALKNYREKMGVPAKLIVCAMTATNFTIADPTDPGMLDVVGFDTATPKVISEFSAIDI